MKVTLAVYSLRVRLKGSSTSFQAIDNFDGKKTDFFDVASKFFKEILNINNKDSEAQQVLSITKIDSDKRVLAGLIHAGQYGQACDVLDVTSAQVVFKKSKTNADMLPFYFRLDVPREANEAIIVIQKSSHLGIKTALTELMGKYFSSKYEDYKLDVDPLLPSELVEKSLRKGSVSEIRFIKIGIPKDLAEAATIGGHKETHGVMKLIIRAQKGKFLKVAQRIQKYLKTPGTKGAKGFYELKDLTKFEPDRVQVKVSFTGKPRLVDLNDLRSSPLYDVTKDIELGDDGNPTYDSLNKAAEDLAEEIRQSVYGVAKGDE